MSVSPYGSSLFFFRLTNATDNQTDSMTDSVATSTVSLDFWARLTQNWESLLGCTLGLLFNVLVAAISLFHHRIDGDYKYFICNEAFANLALTLSTFSSLIYKITVSLHQLYNTPPVVIIIITDFGHVAAYMPMWALMLTLTNRLMRLSPLLNPYYDRFMSKLLCISYCVISNLLILLFVVSETFWIEYPAFIGDFPIICPMDLLICLSCGCVLVL